MYGAPSVSSPHTAQAGHSSGQLDWRVDPLFLGVDVRVEEVDV